VSRDRRDHRSRARVQERRRHEPMPPVGRACRRRNRHVERVAGRDLPAERVGGVAESEVPVVGDAARVGRTRDVAEVGEQGDRLRHVVNDGERVVPAAVAAVERQGRALRRRAEGVGDQVARRDDEAVPVRAVVLREDPAVGRARVGVDPEYGEHRASAVDRDVAEGRPRIRVPLGTAK